MCTYMFELEILVLRFSTCNKYDGVLSFRGWTNQVLPSVLAPQIEASLCINHGVQRLERLSGFGILFIHVAAHKVVQAARSVAVVMYAGFTLGLHAEGGGSTRYRMLHSERLWSIACRLARRLAWLWRMCRGPLRCADMACGNPASFQRELS